ncbi:hypothetical protein Patl1_01225 [Pistacia atlantica]|uniref:Uncharacterized protein n=1 Tax=Pistacia atlantica TaxID=434234 RepID=A0ACC1C9E5_9ROSI|nr:hypothetical protein Patl1_01225 [Pistacia atlantica]
MGILVLFLAKDGMNQYIISHKLSNWCADDKVLSGVVEGTEAQQCLRNFAYEMIIYALACIVYGDYFHM